MQVATYQGELHDALCLAVPFNDELVAVFTQANSEFGGHIDRLHLRSKKVASL